MIVEDALGWLNITEDSVSENTQMKLQRFCEEKFNVTLYRDYLNTKFSVSVLIDSFLNFSDLKTEYDSEEAGCIDKFLFTTASRIILLNFRHIEQGYYITDLEENRILLIAPIPKTLNDFISDFKRCGLELKWK